AAHLSVEELLNEFSANDLSRAISIAGLPAGGSKVHRVYLLLDAAQRRHAGAAQVLALFKTDALRRVCSQLGIRATSKVEMISVLSALLGSAASDLALESEGLEVPTLQGVVDFLSQLVLPWRMVRNEAQAEVAIARALAKRFGAVSTQY